MDQEMKEIFLHEKPSRILLTLLRKRKMHVRDISREIDATYSHTVRLMKRLSQKDIVKWQKSGRKKMYMLSSSGEELAEGISRLFGPTGDIQVEHEAGVKTVF